MQTYTLDATQDKRLLDKSGWVQEVGRILEELQGQDPLPPEVQVEAFFPSEGYVHEIEGALEKLNKVIEPRGFMDKIANQAFRSMSGVKGDLRAVQSRVDPANPNHLSLTIDLRGLSREDVERFAEFLSKNAHRVS